MSVCITVRDDPPVVAHCLPDDNLADDLADQQGIGDVRADGRGVFFGVFSFEEDIGHGPWRYLGLALLS